MCTAASYRFNGKLYFGRTLDNVCSYGEEVVLSPRSYPLWRGGGDHFAVMGMAAVKCGLPLYYDAVNEKGLCMAGLNFTSSAHYGGNESAPVKLAQYEFLPYILGTCQTVEQAVAAIKNICVTRESFNGIPPAPLHWLISDGKRDVAAEFTREGTKVYDNAFGVLTNEPPFESQLVNLAAHMHASADEAKNRLCPGAELPPFCSGLGGLGLPGDYSSPSRFVRAAFVRAHVLPRSGEEGLWQILLSAAVPRGCCAAKGGWQHTMYASCIDAHAGEYAYVVGAGRAAVRMNFCEGRGLAAPLRRPLDFGGA